MAQLKIGLMGKVRGSFLILSIILLDDLKGIEDIWCDFKIIFVMSLKHPPHPPHQWLL